MEPWHLAFSPGVRPVSVRVDGVEVVTNGQASRIDRAEILAKSREQAERLFGRL